MDTTNQKPVASMEANPSKRLCMENVTQKDYPSYLVMSSIEEGALKKVSPFVIAKVIQGLVGDVKTAKRLRSGSLLIEVNNSRQAKRLLELTDFFQVPVKVEPHRSLNTCDGVITSWDLSDCTEEEIKEGLSDQKVISVRRLKTRRSGTLKDTNSFVLTFALPKLPASIYVCYNSIQVRQYIPKPVRCFRCQRYGHTSSNCKGEELCGRCSLKKHEGDCSEKEKCVNCQKEHPAWSASCPMFLEEKKIQEIKTSKKITYGEAKKEFRALHPVFSGLSYSQVTAKKYVDAAVQTHTPSVCAPCKGVFLPAKLKNSASINITKDKAKATAESDSSGENSPSSKKAKSLFRKTPIRKPNLEEDAISDDMMDADPSEVAKHFKCSTKPPEKGKMRLRRS